MNEQWRKLQERWRRFQDWQAHSPGVELGPPERLAEIGALVDVAQRAGGRRVVAEAEDVRARIQGIVLMRKRLSVLRSQRAT